MIRYSDEDIRKAVRAFVLWAVDSEMSEELRRALWNILEKEEVFRRIGMNPLQAQALVYTLRMVLRKIANGRYIEEDDDAEG